MANGCLGVHRSRTEQWRLADLSAFLIVGSMSIASKTGHRLLAALLVFCVAGSASIAYRTAMRRRTDPLGIGGYFRCLRASSDTRNMHGSASLANQTER